MNKNPSDIRNIRAYLSTACITPLTIDNYYSALVNHDFVMGRTDPAGSKKPKTYDYSLCEDTL